MHYFRSGNNNKLKNKINHNFILVVYGISLGKRSR